MIPLFDLKRQYKGIRNEVEPAMNSVMESGCFILGENVSVFEEEFARYIGTRHCIGVASGTDALMIALRAIGVERGDEVITAANTASPTVMAIVNAGAVPVLVDCDRYFNINVSQIGKMITKRTKAIVPVHLYGQPCDMRELQEIVEKHALSLVEDACQAHGASYGSRNVGSFGVGCFSFYPSKNLGCYGDGGAITTDDDELAEKMKMLRFYGQKAAVYHSLTEGYNSRLDEIHAAVLRVKLRHLDSWNDERRKHAKRYDELLGGIVETPLRKEGRKHIYHLYVVMAERRDELREYIKSNGIGTGVHYPYPIHRQEAFRSLGGSFPVSEADASSILSLPMFPELRGEEIEEVASRVTEFTKMHQ
ncbi:MAG: DegT/DnrJ/EryC1/StrS family aminotransferase [Candidatus Aenigmarchaeota archaeon]|nr:DegT/DnrJ/EryC1/StrS family aminotransferase [Candidatus Aenigmarchaeota archaeon]